jgi:hypothetical protein
MAITYQDKWEVNIQHSIYDYLKTAIDADFNSRITFVAEWPSEDDKLKMPADYDALPETEKPRYIKLPAIAIELRSPEGFANIEMGSRNEWTRVTIQVYVQATSKVEYQILTRYIANRFKNYRMDIKDYSAGYPNVNATTVGYLDTERPGISNNPGLGEINSSLKYGGVVVFTGRWEN